VEVHQRWGKPEEVDTPEFTIEVAYKTRSRSGPIQPGYRYVLKWLENGEQKQRRSYGFATKGAAVDAAKAKAREVARELVPVHVETYTPEEF
jgi:hypothetical protein